ncbi:MAG: methyltransferase domain-containing protein [Nanoarchaeota archaeon]
MMQENNPSYDFISELAKKYKGKTIVDNGCGKNEFKRLYNKNIIGLEVKNNIEADIIIDGKNLPIKNKSVDLFLSNFVLEHVEDEDSYLEEMRRCLKDKGTIILSIPRTRWYISYFLNPGTYIMMIKGFNNFIKNPLRFHTHGHPHKHSILKELMEWKERRYENKFRDKGYEIKEKYRTCNFLSLNVHYAKIFGKINMPEMFRVHTTYVLNKN